MPFAGVQTKRKTEDLGDTDIQKPILSQRSFCRHSYFISRRPGRHRFSLYYFIMGRWETPPRIPPGLSNYGWGVPLILLLKPQSGGYSLAPRLSGGLSPEIGKGAAEPTSLAVKAGGPEHARATAMAPRGPERGRAGQGRVKNDLAMEKRGKEVRGCAAPQGCKEKRR